MRLTIFGDVHGNLTALEKLFKLEKSETDFFVCHGDVVNYGPWSSECVSFLNDYKNCTVLKGNHEDYFINGSYDGTNRMVKSSFDYCFLNFDKSLTSILKSYKNEYKIENYIIKHTINNQYIFSDTDLSNLKIDSNYIIGHSHQQFEKAKNEFKIFNTGSLGQNRQFLNQSCYLKYDTEKNMIELKSFTHNIDKVISHMKMLKFPSICIDYYYSKGRI